MDRACLFLQSLFFPTALSLLLCVLVYGQDCLRVCSGINNNNNNNNNKSIYIAPNQSRLLSGALQNMAN